MRPEPGLTARAVVSRIIDGDTLDVELRLPVRIRLLDCWAPEVSSPQGLKSLLAIKAIAPEGSAVIVQIPTNQAHNLKDVMTFGRVLGRVWREGDEESLSEAMVGSGNATKEKR